MRRIIGTTFVLLCSLGLFAQEDAYEGEPTTIFWGWEMGIESGIMYGKAAPSEAALAKFSDVKGNVGIGVSAGFSASFPLSEKLAFRPQLMLTILPTSLTYDFVDFREETQQIYPLTCDLPLHLAINNPLQTRKLGLLIGPAVEFKIPALESGRPASSATMLRGDIGLALPRTFGKSDVLLELVYGVSLTNILSGGDATYDNWYSTAGRHRLGFRINFY